MNPSSYIAKRYFRSKKKKNFIQVLSWISMVGVAIGTMALVVVLSVFNGLQDLIRSLYNSFDPDLKIEATVGKSFILTDSLKSSIQAIEGVAQITEVIEDNALIMYRDQQVVARMKGVDDTFLNQHKLDSFMLRGELRLKEGGVNFAILGSGVAYELSTLIGNDFYAMRVAYPRKIRPGAAIPRNPVRSRIIKPGGIFSVEKEYNENYFFVPLAFAQELTGYGDKRTALELTVDKDYSLSSVKSEVIALLGDTFQVLDSDEQHSGLLRALKIEKLFVFITFSFILAVASFNIFFSLSMLAIEKKKDIAVLFSMGATKQLVKRIFLKEGAIIALLGTTTGLLLGLIICTGQAEFGWVSMGMQTSIVTAYPVKMKLLDFALISLAITLITLLASYRPAMIASRVKVVTNLG